MNRVSEKSLPDLSFPSEQSKVVKSYFQESDVILEYGSGQSTMYAAHLSDKLIFSVESDEDWSFAMRRRLDAVETSSTVVLHYVDIGATGLWGRPVDTRKWYFYHNYPISVWNLDFFCAPDVVLIDGRFRLACLVTTLLKVSKPTIVLFDDYTKRPQYHEIERFISPIDIVDRMAIFEAKPGLLSSEKFIDAVPFFFKVMHDT